MVEMTYSIIAVSCASFLLVIWAWRVLSYVWLRPKRLEKCLRQQGFKGNSYKLWYGDVKERSKMMKDAFSKPINNFSHAIVPRVVPFCLQTINKYGKNSFYWVGPRPLVIISDPEHIKEIFNKNFNFLKPNTNPLVKLLAGGVTVYEGEKWTKHRRLVNSAFHQEKLKHMLPAFHLSCSDMVSKWEKMASSEDGLCEIDAWPYLQTMTSDVISRTAFGSNYEEGRRIFELQTEQANHVSYVLTQLYIPGYRFLPTKRNRRMKEIANEVQDLIRGIISNKVRAMEAGKGGNDDLLGIMLDSNFKSMKKNGSKNFSMTMDEIIDECKLFYLGGQETTSSLLVWTMILLSMHQNWQALARDEVLKVFGHNAPSLEGLNHLKIVTMILYEVLRLYPPVVEIVRITVEETKLGEITLPAGVSLASPVLILHHDKETWGDDAEEFKPDRFSEGISNVTKGGQVQYYPFGWGPRICLGQNFSMLESKLAMAMILQRFSFELSPSYTHAPCTGLLLRPQHGAHIILRKLSS